jgi:GT2 family glycosyltransferase
MQDICVTIPTYNRVELLCNLINSVPSDVKVVVSDNGSYVPEDIKQRYRGVEFLTSPEVIEVFENWNRALLNAQGHYVILSSDDDVFHKDTFEIIRKEISDHPDADILIFGHYNIDKNNNIVSEWKPDRYTKAHQPEGFRIFQFGVEARMPSIVFKKTLIEQIGGFDTNFKVTAGDSELVQRALLTGNSLFVPHIISSYRVWDGGSTAQTLATVRWVEEIDRWTKNISGIAERKIKQFNKKLFCDEIRGRNIFEGVRLLYKKGQAKEAIQFITKVGFPTHATWKTKLKLRMLLIACTIRKTVQR